MHCRAANMMRNNSCVDGANGFNSHFTDSGLFGMTVEGPGSHGDELMKLLTAELNALREPIDEVELNRAKNIMKMQLLTHMEKTGDRLQEIASNFMIFGDLTFHQYCDYIDNVTGSQINAVASKCLSGKPTMLVNGGAINLVPSASDVSRQLN